MELYSHKGNFPEVLPFSIRLDNGETRTDLKSLSIEELNEYGFVGPFYLPTYDDVLEKVIWDNEKFVVVQNNEDEINNIKKNRSDYDGFWNKFLSSSIYLKMRSESSKNLEVNTICTEMIGFLSDARRGDPNHEIIQKYIDIICIIFGIEGDIKVEFQNLLSEFNLDFYKLKDSEYILSHTYDFDSNKVIDPKPFDSWILDENKNWVAPIPMPNDGKHYSWDEQSQNWYLISTD